VVFNQPFVPTLIAVMANGTLRRPSMFVFITRRMCWNFSGITSDWNNKAKGIKV